MSSLNPYETTGTAQSKVDSPKPRRSGLLASIAITLACLIAITMLVTQRSFAKMIVEFGIKTPLATSLAFSPFLPLALLAITLAAVLLSTNPSYHSMADRWNGLLVILSVVAIAAYVWGVVSPLMQLLLGLSK